MKIAQLTPGSGDNFYCENCLRDAALVKAVRNNGHDMIMIPMYLPLQTDKEEKLANAPIFFGGINVYLQQKMKLFRNTPRWLDKILDSPKLLGLVAKKASMTSASDLAETTISMLNGEHGRQVKELERLVDWLAEEENRPDIVCLSNLLLAGMAKEIKEKVGVPVVSLLQDEDGFIDGLGGDWAKQAWGILRERCENLDGFISVSRYYADVMKERLGLADEKVHVVRIGIDVDKFTSIKRCSDAGAIGFLSRMCRGKGLDILVDAFIVLKKQEVFRQLKLKVTGGKTSADDEFINEQKRKLQATSLLADVEFIDEFFEEGKKEFFESIDVLCVPAREEAAYGLFVIEAFAAGVLVVEPDLGVFKELIEESKAGVVYEPNNPGWLAEVMEPILRDEGLRTEYSINGRKAARELFDVKQSAKNLVKLFGKNYRF